MCLKYKIIPTYYISVIETEFKFIANLTISETNVHNKNKFIQELFLVLVII